jgi:hypothetical protein
MCRPGVGAANPLFSLRRVLERHTAPASRTKSHRTAEEYRTTCDIAPLFIHTHRKIKEFLKLSILLQHFSQYAQVCKSLGRAGSYESM